MDGQEKKYWAFISYSHQDTKWGDWLHKKLETYKIPKALIASAGREGIVPKRIYPIFRDREELPSAADLGENINQALRQSRYLIVICSPRSAKSLWVNEEIKTFKALGNNNKVLCLIVDGEPNASDKPELKLEECFSEAIKYKVSPEGEITTERVEPIAADARKDKDGKANALLKIIAGVLGVNYDALKQRDQVRQVRKMQYFVAAALVLVGVFSFLSIGFYQAKIQAEKEKSIAKVETKKANHNVGLVFAEKAKTADKEYNSAKASLYALAALNRLIPEKKPLVELESRSIAIKKTSYQSAINIFSSQHHQRNVNAIAYSPNGKLLVSSGKDNTLRLWNISSGEELAVYLHPGGILSIAFSPDGKIIASGGEDGVVRLWDISSGAVITIFRGHIDWVKCVAFSPNGKTLASGSRNEMVRLWDIGSGELLKLFKGHTGSVNDVVFSPDGKTLATGGEDGTIGFWNIASGKILRRIKKNKRFRETQGYFNRITSNSIAFSPNGKVLASGGNDKSIDLWSIASGELLDVLTGHEGKVTSVSFSPDGKVLASGSTDNTVRLWNISNGETLSVINKGTGTIESVIFSPDGKTLAFDGFGNVIHLWEINSGKVMNVIRGHAGDINNIIFSPDGKTLYSSGRDDKTYSWEVASGKNISFIKTHLMIVASSPNGMLFASHEGKNLILWDVFSGVTIATLEHADWINDIGFSPDGKILASSSVDGTIRLWNIDNGKVSGRMRGRDSVSSIAFSPDGKTLVSASKNIIQLWDIASKKILSTFNGHTARINDVTFSPNGRMLVSGGKDNTLRLWDVDTGNLLTTFEGHIEPVRRVLFTSNSKVLISGSNDNTIRLWDVVSGKGISVIEGSHDMALSPDSKTLALWHDEAISLIDISKLSNNRKFMDTSVRCFEFSPDGKTLALAGSDNIIRLRDIVTGKIITIFEGRYPGNVLDITFSPDGKTLISTGRNNGKTISLWDVVSGKALPILQKYSRNASSVNFFPDGKSLLLSHDRKKWQKVDVSSGKTLATSPSLFGETGTALSPDGKFLVWGTGKMGTINLYEVSSGKIINVFEGHHKIVNSINFSPDGKILASGSSDKTVHLWDVASGKILKIFSGHTSDVFSIAFSPDGKTLASGGRDRTIRLWNVASGKVLAVIEGHTENITQIDFSPDGNTLISNSLFGNPIRLWDMTSFKRTNDSQYFFDKLSHQWGMQLKDLEIISSERTNNLYPVKVTPPNWSKNHPFHWLPKAEQGDGNSMIQLGNLYLHDNNVFKAKHWFTLAQEISNYKEIAEERLRITERIVESVAISNINNVNLEL